MSPRTGRPPSENPKKHEKKIRFSDSEIEKLEYAAEVLGLTKSDIIRRGIDHMYVEAQKKAQK